MLGGGPKLQIEFLDEQECYTNGDVVRGMITIESSKSYGVRKLVAKLRCEEFAQVWVPNGQGGYYEIETHRHLSLGSTLFPQPSITTNESSSFTFGAGVQKFEFKFRIPFANKFPQSLAIKGSDSGIRWYVKGSLSRGQVLSSTKRAILEFRMVPRAVILPDSGQFCVFKADQNVNAYKRGYAQVTSTPGGWFKQMLSSDEYKVRTNVELSLCVPEGGIYQAPLTTNIGLDLCCQDANLLLVRQINLSLKQKIIVSVNNGWNTSVYRDCSVLVQTQPNAPLKTAIADLQTLLKTNRIEQRFPETFANRNFDVSYKIVAEVLLAASEKTRSVEKIRLSVPVYLHSFSNLNAPAQPGDEDLPFYSFEPQDGEETFGVVQDDPEYYTDSSDEKN